jgi:hypothetical protein
MKRFYNAIGKEIDRENSMRRVAVISRRLMIFSSIVFDGVEVHEISKRTRISALMIYLDLYHMFISYFNQKAGEVSMQYKDGKLSEKDMWSIKATLLAKYVPDHKDSETINKFINKIRADRSMVQEYRVNFSDMFLYQLDKVAARIDY